MDVPGSPLDLTAVTFGQRGDRMVLKMTTSGEWSSKQLSSGAGRSVCVKLFKDPKPNPRARICVVRTGGTTGLHYTPLRQDGQPEGIHALKAEVSRRDTHSLEATFAPAAAGLRTGPYAWQAETAWTDPGACAPPTTCIDRAPDDGAVSARIVPAPVVELAGCVAHGPTQRRSGARGSREVALTFDDGPSPYTPAVLRVLKREHVPATFFLIGKQVPGHGALLRRMLHGGSMIGNHTLAHANVAGAGAFADHQIAATQAAIRRAAGFEPCLFRPPYGATSAALSGVVRSRGMLSILWDVDPQDWRDPGTGAIVSRVLGHARSGSIVILHDGGGPRGQTVAALPTIIRGLRRRGLRFVTVTDLLRLRLREHRA